MTAQLLGEWGWLANLENTAGTVAIDGTQINDAPVFGAGPTAGSGSLRFTETSGHDSQSVDLGRTGLEPSQDGFVVECWFKIPATVPGSVGTLGLVSKALAAASSRFRVGVIIGGDDLAHIDYAVRWKDSLAFGVIDTVTLARDVWHHLMVLDSNTGYAVWLNGTQQANGSRSFDNTTSPTWEDYPWRVGWGGTSLGDQHTTPNLQIGSVRIFQAHSDGDFTDREKWRTKVGPPTTEPYAHYDLREGSGSAAPLTGYAVPFNPTTGAWAEPHRIVKGMTSGYPGWVDFGDSLATLNEWTLALDVKPYGFPGAGDYDHLGTTLAGATPLYLQHTNDAKPTAYYSSELKASTAMVAGTRHRVVYVSRGDRLRIYLDGVQVADTASVVPWTTGNAFNWLWNSTFDGESYALRFWRHGLTAAQVAAIPAPAYPASEATERGMKVYRSGSWQTAPVKVYRGGSWQQAPVKVWDGEAWV